MPQSVLLIPVPEADFAVRPRLAREAPELLPADEDETAAHITLLCPFAAPEQLDEGVLAELGDLFADVTPFAFALTEVSSFPGGVTYLAPDPAGPFRQLTHELSTRFPEYPPYGDVFDEVVPHLTVSTLVDGADRVRAELRPRLPVRAQARQAALYWFEPGGTRRLATFPFGTTAA